MKNQPKLVLVAACVMLCARVTKADEVSDLKAQLQALQQQMNLVQQQLQKLSDDKQQQAAAQPVTKSEALPEPSKTQAGTRKADGISFYTSRGEGWEGQVTPYGNMNVSFDTLTKGLGGKMGPDGPPVGNMGWLPDLSTNISYVGVRGYQNLMDRSFTFIYQFETQVDLASTSGLGETNSSESNVVKGALTSRNTYIGFSSPVWGAIKFGKTDAPYKNSTMRMNPFYGMIGDYQSIMGNTGGDNRVEFGTRMDHSIWWESPVWGGFSLSTLFSPGQNRATNNDNLAAGESDCTGGNIPGSGGIVPLTCSDGSWGDAVSASLTYTNGPLYIATAYERHMKVNRESDITGLYASGNAASQVLEAQDVADEDAGKIGVQYRFPNKTSVSGIFETMHRYVASDLQFQNERQRLGTWFSVSQPITRNYSLNFGWARAFRTPGDPGQHNDSNITPPGGVPGTDFTAGANSDNSANMFTVAIKHQLNESLSVYTGWAMALNGPAAHYDLGAGGRAIATDCHDAFAAAGGLVGSNPHCWTGGTLDGASVGMAWKF